MIAVAEQRNSPWPVVLSLLLHATVVLLLVLGGLSSNDKPQDAPVAVELWSSAPPPPPQAPSVAVPQPAPRPQPAPPKVAPAPVEPPRAEVNLGEKRKPLPEKKPEPKPEPKPAPKPEPKPEPKREAKPEVVKQAKPQPAAKPVEKAPPVKTAKADSVPDKHAEKKAAALPPGKGSKAAPRYNPEADDLLADLGSSNTTKKGNARSDQAGQKTGVVGGSANGTSLNLDGYASKVQAKVKPLVQVPPELSGNPKAVVQVTLLPSLEVRAVRLLASSGNTAYDEAVQRAIWEAKTFPSLPAGASFTDFRQLKLEFRPH
ncbi:protein TolA [Pseudogulbenkiania sp. NH8B]|uniref:cell envelope integrity protein TolA n=1 Tax=Pseudogulbenkiania sp. (strain NH8B) TaxID=748280 RepID=UPI00022791E4|nr:cell envelope integrity protein TolA [Pseudogulbenkiania sp. NH8B]BAK75079.1 protein TolA [Pseudogulbenkiania sp. NH8B]